MNTTLRDSCVTILSLDFCGCAFDGRAVRLIQTRGLARGHRPEDWMLMSPACWPGSGASGHGVTTPAWSPPPPHPTAGSRINGGHCPVSGWPLGCPEQGVLGPGTPGRVPTTVRSPQRTPRKPAGASGEPEWQGCCQAKELHTHLRCVGAGVGWGGWIGVLIHDPKTHILL